MGHKAHLHNSKKHKPMLQKKNKSQNKGIVTTATFPSVTDSALKRRRGVPKLQRPMGSIAAPLIFILVTIFQAASTWLDRVKKKGSKSAAEIQLRGEIKQLLKEASVLSQPATFAQAAKLRRMAAAKEKDLVKIQELHNMDEMMSYDLYQKVLLIVKVVTYSVLILCFWKIPVAAVSKQLIQPFGKVLSWKSGGEQNDNLMVGIIPWLIVSMRVSKLLTRLVK